MGRKGFVPLVKNIGLRFKILEIKCKLKEWSDLYLFGPRVCIMRVIVVVVKGVC